MAFNLDRFELTTLRLIVAAVDAGSLTAGAERLDLSLAAASKRVAELESHIGTPLLQRSKRRVVPTAAGSTLLPQAMEMIARLEQMALAMLVMLAMSDVRGGLAGHLRLWANTSAFGGFLPALLAAFCTSHPGVVLDLEVAISEEAVRAGGTAAKRGSLATRTSSARSVPLKAWLGAGRTACGLPSPAVRPSCARQRCRVRTSIPAISLARCNRAPAACATPIVLGQGLAILEADHSSSPLQKIACTFFDSTSSAAVSARARSLRSNSRSSSLMRLRSARVACGLVRSSSGAANAVVALARHWANSCG